MKVAILCGGKGSRLGSNINGALPKPLVKLDDKPMLWHVMNIYAQKQIKDFVLLAGYKVNMIRDWVDNSGDIPDDWEVEVMDTGEDTLTGGRIYQYLKRYPEASLLTYGDGLSKLLLNDLLNIFYTYDYAVVLTLVHPPSRFGRVKLIDSDVIEFVEKPMDEGWINGGFMVITPEILEYYTVSNCNFEKDVLPRLVKCGLVGGITNEFFWQCVDTPRDLEYIKQLIKENKKLWLEKT